MVQELNEKDFEESVLKSDTICVVDFWAEWCGPCKILAPILEKVSKEVKKINFYKVNVDENTDLAQKYDIRSIPCLIVFKKGEEIDRFVGALSESALKEKLKGY